MAKMKNDYFKLAEQQMECCVEASHLLVEFLSRFSVDTILAEKGAMHAIENKADEIHHDIHTRLAAEFITPIDQEDILHLAQIIDDITDAIDEVVLYFYMYHMEQVPTCAASLATLVNRCVTALYEAAKELKNFKKPTTLRTLLVQVNAIEGEADAAYVEAVHTLFSDNQADIRTVLGSRAIYERLERCCDLCEHAADVIEQIIIKNT